MGKNAQVEDEWDDVMGVDSSIEDDADQFDADEDDFEADDEDIDDDDDIDADEDEESDDDEEEGEDPDEEDEPEERVPVVFDKRQQAKINEIVNRKTRKTREMEERALRAEQRLQELEAQQPQPQRPEIPELPDRYDSDFAEKMAARDQALREAAAWDAQQAINEQHRLRQQQEAQAKAQQEMQTALNRYNARAKKLGVSPTALKQAGQVVGQGVTVQLAAHLLEDEAGPALTVFLAQNPAILDELNTMSPMKAAAYLERKVKPNLFRDRKQAKRKPRPTQDLRGGMPRKQGRGPKGATFQ